MDPHEIKTAVGGKHPRARLQALRTVGVFEFAKGVAALAAAVSLYWLNPSDVADAFLSFLHMGPDRHLARFIMGMADRLSDIAVWQVVLFAAAYSGLRFAEAYGLWKARAWAEWIALVSGALYLPLEIRALAHRITFFHISVLTVNVAIVIFMFYLRIYAPQRERRVARELPVQPL
jgi:uncharacterized membrane protein (DUF2068 family)